MSVLDLPAMPDTAAPIILPGLLAGLGVTRRTEIPELPESYEDFLASLAPTETP